MNDRSFKRIRHELSEFLIQHRNQLVPGDVGLADTGRRRTPGLRREEVAALAGVGLTWYTWFEQGRDVKVSEKFLLGVAHALKLDDAECSHLFLLAHRRPPPLEASHFGSVPANIQCLLDGLSMPAYVQNLRWDVVAWNAPANELFGFANKPFNARNILRIFFTDSAMRHQFGAWSEDEKKLMAQFRFDLAIAPKDEEMQALIEDLKKQSSSFRQSWDKRSTAAPQRGIAAITNMAGVTTHFSHETLVVDEHRHL